MSHEIYTNMYIQLSAAEIVIHMNKQAVCQGEKRDGLTCNISQS